MSIPFTERLAEVQKRTGSLLCVGLDTDPDKLPAHLRSRPDGVLEFNRRIVEATKDLVCAYKPNLAFYEALGERGWTVLHETLRHIPGSVITIGDAKRGDIGNTAERYAHALFNDLGFDAMTVNPYLGGDAVEPFLRDPAKGVFLLALTSNSGSKDIQRAKVGGAPLFERIVRLSRTWNTRNNLGLVVGATHPRDLKRIRSLAPDMPFLIPGVGSQGGSLRDAVRHGCTKAGVLAVINASRSVLYASSDTDFADAARAEALRMRNEMRELQNEFF